MKKILMASFEVPGYGGSATTGYQRFASLQVGYPDLPLSWANLVPEEVEEQLMRTFGARLGNPLGLQDVHNCRIDFPPFRFQPALQRLVQEQAPDILVGWGYIAAWLLHKVAPDVPLLFMSAGFRWAQEVIEAGHCPDYIRLKAHLESSGSQGLPPFHPRQREAYLASDCCVTHAPMIYDLYRTLFPDEVQRLHPQVLWRADLAQAEAAAYAHLQRPWAERDLDLLFVASSWGRAEKNFPAVQAIARACPHLRLGLVGHCQQPPEGVRAYGFLSRAEEVMELMGRARALVCPSVFDAAPGVLYEGAAMGCNVVASKNCGNWSLCAPPLLADPGRPESWVECCQRAVEHAWPARWEAFSEVDSEAVLLQILARLSP